MKWIFFAAKPAAFRSPPRVDVLTLKSGKIVHGFYEGLASEFIRFLTTEGLLTVNPMHVESMAICSKAQTTPTSPGDTIVVVPAVRLPEEFRNRQHQRDEWSKA